MTASAKFEYTRPVITVEIEGHDYDLPIGDMGLVVAMDDYSHTLTVPPPP